MQTLSLIKMAGSRHKTVCIHIHTKIHTTVLEDSVYTLTYLIAQISICAAVLQNSGISTHMITIAGSYYPFGLKHDVVSIFLMSCASGLVGCVICKIQPLWHMQQWSSWLCHMQDTTIVAHATVV